MNVKPTLVEKQKGRTNWNAVNSMTDEEIELAAKRDLDAPLLTKNELAQFKRVSNGFEA